MESTVQNRSTIDNVTLSSLSSTPLASPLPLSLSSPLPSLSSPHLNHQLQQQPFTAATMKCWETAKSRTFFARDNVSNFLNWCRLLGVKDAVLFET